jgi:uncharacterized protein
VEAAFWDTSAVVPLCIVQQASARLHQLHRQYSLVVWWATPVEAQSAFARDLRSGVLTQAELQRAQQRLESLRDIWHEVEPTEPVRNLAEVLLERYPLRAADALQLAAAYTWSRNRPFRRPLISGDTKLLEAAKAVGFNTIQIP